MEKVKPKFNKNDRVEFKDASGRFHVGYVKKVSRRGFIVKHWKYDICEAGKCEGDRKVFAVREDAIFGTVEDYREKKNGKNFSVVKDLRDIGTIITRNKQYNKQTKENGI